MISNSNTGVTHLLGQSVVVTRPSAQASTLTSLLRRYGALPLEYPLLILRPVQKRERLLIADAGARLGAGDYDATIFASVNAVDYFFDVVAAADIPTQRLFFAVGRKTSQALSERGFQAAFPQQADSEHLLQTIATHYQDSNFGIGGRRFLMPRARGGRAYLLERLRDDGAVVDAPALYDTEALADGPALPAHFELHWLTFTSPSAVRAMALRSPIDPHLKIACIGPTTAKAATEAGMRVTVVAAEQSIEALVRAMAEEHTGDGQVFSDF